MNVQELIDELNEVEDKTLQVRIESDILAEHHIYENQWVKSIDVHANQSGYEMHGEVVIFGKE